MREQQTTRTTRTTDRAISGDAMLRAQDHAHHAAGWTTIDTSHADQPAQANQAPDLDAYDLHAIARMDDEGAAR